jgi:hypothetical protein
VSEPKYTGPMNSPKPKMSRGKKAGIWAGSIVAAFVVIGAIGDATGAGKKTPTTPVAAVASTRPAASSPAAHPSSPSSKAAAVKPKPARPVVAVTTSAAAPAPTCTLPDNQDLIERDDDPGAEIIAQELGEVDLEYCTTTLSSFEQTAGQGAGECTTIAWAYNNPGYDVNAIPASPLKDVIDEAGPGC